MPAIYVVDVPEFRALVTTSEKRDGYSVTKLPCGYYRIENPEQLEFNRRDLKLKPALWYGCVTGGLRGQIVQFDRDTLRIVDEAGA